jgi:hypothetical protein
MFIAILSIVKEIKCSQLGKNGWRGVKAWFSVAAVFNLSMIYSVYLGPAQSVTRSEPVSKSSVSLITHWSQPATSTADVSAQVTPSM